ncbi:MAG TPA: hypothetical protein VF144_13550 [Chitinophagaceae bacterium]
MEEELSIDEIIFGIIGLVFILSFLIAYIFFLVAQQNTLRSIKPHNQKISPGQVWLQLVPGFNFVWQFIVLNRIADSIRAEIDDRISTSFLNSAEPVFLNDKTPRPTYNMGLAACILSLGGFLPFIGLEPIATIGSVISMTFLACWIVYWTQIVHYKNQFLKYPW